MEMPESSIGKLHELKATSDCEITKTISSKPKLEICLEICDKRGKFTYTLDENHVIYDENNNTVYHFNFDHEKVEKFVPNIIAKKYSLLKNSNFVDTDTEIPLKCQRCSVKTKNASSMSTHVRLAHGIGDCNDKVLDSSGESHDTLEVEVPEIKRSGILKYLLVSFGDIRDLYTRKIINDFISGGDCGINYLGNSEENFESEHIKNELEFEMETDFVEKREQKEKFEEFSWTWDSTYDENNNDLNELIQRQNSIGVTERFQDFMVQNYISVGKKIPDIVELKVDDTKMVNLDFHVCPVCEGKFENSLALKNHLVDCEDKPRLFCSYCSYKTKYVKLITNHILKRHFKNKSVECPRCYKKMANRNSLSTHLSYCGKERVFHCDECSYRTNIKCNLRMHILRIHASREEECSQCNKKLKNLLCLKAHLRLCKKGLVSQSESIFKIMNYDCKLKNRCKDIHVIKGKFVKVCPKCFHSVGSSKKMICCLCKSQVVYQCRKCAKSFDKYRPLKRHTLKC